MRRLSTEQTRAAIANLEIERSLTKALGFTDPAREVRYDFHAHSKHQLLLPRAGFALLETSEKVFFCAPPGALWIPARVKHATTIGEGAVSSLYFPVRRNGPIELRVRELTASTLLREMAAAASAGLKGPRAFNEAFFRVVEELCRRAPEPPRIPNLPRPKSELLSRAIHWMLDHLETARLGEAAAAAGLSERSLRRHFQAEFALTPERYLQQARLMKAARLLLERPRRSIAEVALEVGYAQQSAFTAAFRRYTGLPPAAFRKSAAQT